MKLIVVDPPSHLLAREYPLHPLAGDPPLQRVGNVPVSLANLAADRPRILEAAAAVGGYWVVDPAFTPPSPPRIIDFDFLLYVLTACWLEPDLREGQDQVDVITVVLPWAQSSPAKARLMDNEGQPLVVSPAYPLTVQKKMLDRLRKLAAAGFVILERDYISSRSTRYLAQPTQAGLARAVWIAQLLDLPLSGWNGISPSGGCALKGTALTP